MNKTNKILVVEDNDALRDQIAQALEFEGYTVLAAANGREGLQVATATPPALIVSDIAMPMMDGHELLRNLRATGTGAAIPIIFLTARVSRGDVRAGMELGADDYLTKPFDMQELLNTVATRLRRQSETEAETSRTITEERSRMLLSLPHELWTPLSGIIGFADLLKESLVPGVPVPADTPELLDQLLASGVRLKHLATNFVLHQHLELARHATGPEQLFVDAGPASADAHTTAVARRVAQASGRARDLMLLSAGPVVVAVSAHFLEKILEEIIGNAFKFSVDGAPVEISLSRGEGVVEWLIADRGIGVNAAEAAGMGSFRQWQREKREQQGLGLGFAIARRLAELNGGSLNLVSREGAGCEARLRLPQGQG